MTTFRASSKNGKFAMESEHEAERFKTFLLKNPDVRLEIKPYLPESSKQRRFFEGGVIKLIVYYQENMDFKDHNDCRQVREWILSEFNGEYKVIGEKSVKVTKSSKGELNQGLLERILDWMQSQGYQTELLVPDDFKYWRDAIYPTGGPETYIEYLLSIGKLQPCR